MACSLQRLLHCIRGRLRAMRGCVALWVDFYLFRGRAAAVVRLLLQCTPWTFLASALLQILWLCVFPVVLFSCVPPVFWEAFVSVAYLHMRQLELCNTCEALLRYARAWPKLGHAHLQVGRPSRRQPSKQHCTPIQAPHHTQNDPFAAGQSVKSRAVLPHAPRSSLFRACAHSRASAGGPAS